MEEQVLRLSTIGQILRRRWRLLLALAALGAVAGLATSLVVEPTYRSGTTLLLQGSPNEDEVLTQAQVAMSSVVVDRAVTELGWDVDLAEVRDSVSAEVVAGSVIRIAAAAPVAEQARLLADKVTEEYIGFSTELAIKAETTTREVLQRRQVTVQQRIDESSRRIGELQGSFSQLDPRNPGGVQTREELQQARDRRDDAIDELAVIERGIAAAEAEASVALDNIRVIEAAAPPEGADPPAVPHFIAGGAGVFALLGMLAVIAVHYGDRRLRRKDDVAAATGAPVLGVVAAGPAVPTTGNDGPSGEHRDGWDGWKAWIAELLREDAPSTVPDDDPALEQLRYGRVLDQVLAGSLAARVLVVLLDGDVPAAAAVARLAGTAAAAGRTASILPDGSGLSATVQAAVSGEPTTRGAVTVLTDSSPSRPDGVVFPLVVVSASRPTVPPQPDVSATLLVITSGTATGAELLGVAQACQDAGHPLSGVLLVRTGAATDESEPPEWTSAPMNGRAPITASNGHGPRDGHRHG